MRFEQLSDMPFVFELDMTMVKNDSFPLKGKWTTEVFKNDNPIVLELGCGKGEYAVGLGKRYPDKNFIGVDIKGARMWYGANTVLNEKLSNIAFLRTRIDFIETFFGPNEVDEIWLTFSDPQPKKPQKRLSSRLFIERYMSFLKPDGIIHLKTDSSLLFDSTLKQIELHNYQLLEKSWDLYGELLGNLNQDTQDILGIRTHYEQIFSEKGFDIKYVKFKLD